MGTTTDTEDVRCPECKHAPHRGTVCLNMASDSECTCDYGATEQPAVEKPNLGLPWTLEGSHPWRIMCETNIPGVKNVVATVAYRPMAELIVRAVNQSAAFAALLSVANSVKDWHAGEDDSATTRAAINAIRERGIAALAQADRLMKGEG